MELLIIQGLFAVLIFAMTMLFVLLGPLYIFKAKADQQITDTSLRLISLCNCFSGGVFLAVCFMGLLPVIRIKFIEVFHMMRVTVTYPVVEMITVLGFFMVLITEQCIHRWNERKEEETQEMMILPINFYKDSSSDETELTPVDSLGKPNWKDSRRKRRSRKDRRQCVPAEDALQSHGHSHVAEFQSGSVLRSLVLLLALSIHSLFEGMAVGLQDKVSDFVTLYLAVIIHECFVSLAMGVNLARSGMQMSTIVKLGVLLCLMIPVGMGIGLALGRMQSILGALINGICQALAEGTFIYVIFLEILPPEINSKTDRLLKVFFLFFGFIVIAALRTVLT